jgi:hypothetical protein
MKRRTEAFQPNLGRVDVFRPQVDFFPVQRMDICPSVIIKQ